MVIIGNFDEVMTTLKTLCALYGGKTPLKDTVALLKIDHRQKKTV